MCPTTTHTTLQIYNTARELAPQYAIRSLHWVVTDCMDEACPTSFMNKSSALCGAPSLAMEVGRTELSESAAARLQQSAALLGVTNEGWGRNGKTEGVATSGWITERGQQAVQRDTRHTPTRWERAKFDSRNDPLSPANGSNLSTNGIGSVPEYDKVSLNSIKVHINDVNGSANCSGKPAAYKTVNGGKANGGTKSTGGATFAANEGSAPSDLLTESLPKPFTSSATNGSNSPVQDCKKLCAAKAREHIAIKLAVAANNQKDPPNHQKDPPHIEKDPPKDEEDALKTEKDLANAEKDNSTANGETAGLSY